MTAESATTMVTAVRQPAQRPRTLLLRVMVCVPLLHSAYGGHGSLRAPEPPPADTQVGSLSCGVNRYKPARRGGIGHIGHAVSATNPRHRCPRTRGKPNAPPPRGVPSGMTRRVRPP
ncbi:hypothetical protein GCM10010448_62310 [Streptomyces glomeratus]|uniref:Secreted protein n=1 Tax=Streptomyces glomeratus TaxID=284452 RepID=A0ABP6M1H6_9ACTN